jgi:hypothetical protein
MGFADIFDDDADGVARAVGDADDDQVRYHLW